VYTRRRGRPAATRRLKAVERALEIDTGALLARAQVLGWVERPPRHPDDPLNSGHAFQRPYSSDADIAGRTRNGHRQSHPVDVP
jgi:hypothetical protein